MSEQQRREILPRQPQTDIPNGQAHTSSSNPGNRRVDRSTAGTIFDFTLPEPSEQEIAALYQQTEHLLDAMELGGVDRSATGHSFSHEEQIKIEPTPTEPMIASVEESHEDDRRHLAPAASVNGHGNGRSTTGARSSIVPTVQNDDEHSQVLPAEALPAIRTHSILSPRSTATRPPSSQSGPLLQPSSARPQPQRTADQTTLRNPSLTSLSRQLGSTRPAPVPAGEQTSASLTATEMDRLESEIAALYSHVNQLQENRRDLTGHALSLLDEARTIVQTQPARLGRADYNLRQVRGIMERARESRRRSVRNAVQLLLYLSLWLAVCAGGTTALILYQQDLIALIRVSVGADSLLMRHALPFLWALLMGGTGGVIGAISSLISHLRAGQEFDRQYVVRYMIQPVMGVVLGVLLYISILIIADVFEMDLLGADRMRWIPAAVALPAGLWQEWVYGLLYRITRLFTFGSRRR